ncbi:hypothetical protein PVV74_17285 [Roseovarius sp. SK2]|uniref:hypothetical protein n=1 Tax=Roseovarius TaxID=74030 RepID=UPI00237ABA79|nr:hypothetical protein [Roseovarius sp. SK2]MDD9727217.1 hypothetical protein [Roseovarius sp. SK2]
MTRKIGESTEKPAGNRGKGRPKGSKNKTTATAKSIIEEAAEGLGGAGRLLAWAKENEANERVFWSSIFPKLMPLQVNGPGESGEHTVIAKITREIVAPSNSNG